MVEVDEGSIIAELNKLKPEIGGGGKVVIKKTIIKSTGGGEIDKESLLEQLRSEMPEGGRVVIKKRLVKSGSEDVELDEEKMMEELKSQLPEGASVSIKKRVVKSSAETTPTPSTAEESVASKIVDKVMESVDDVTGGFQESRHQNRQSDENRGRWELRGGRVIVRGGI